MTDPNAKGGLTPQPPSNEPIPGQPAPPPRPRRRRRWLKVLAAVIVILLLIVLLFPTLASTRPVRSIVLGQINSRLNGRLEVADWSLGWFGNLHLDGVRLLDASGSQLVELRSLTTGTSLSKLARGNLDFGKVVISGLDFNIKREADGALNLAKLMKEEPRSEAGPAAQPSPQPAAQPAPAAQPSKPQKEQKLPDIKAELQLEDTHGTFEDVAKRQTVKFLSITGDIKVPDINQPIENTLEIVLQPLGYAQGKISAGGTVLAVRRNVLDTNQPDVDQKLTINGFDLAAAAPMLGNAVTELAGLTSGSLAVRLKPQQDGVISGEFTSTNFKVGAPAMNGDTFKADSVVIRIPPITLPTAKGLDQLTAGRLTVGSGDNNKVTLVWKSGDGASGSQSSVGFGADVPLQALLNVADRKKPGDTGKVTLMVDVDVAHLANSMPHMVAMRPGVRLDSGRFKLSTDINLTPDQTNLSQNISIDNVKGVNTAKNQPITIQPVTLALSAASQGGSGTIPDLRDIHFDLASGFANGSLTAANLGDVSGKTLLHGQLENVQKELGQVVDFGDAQLAGAFNIGMTSKGNLVGGAGSGPRSAELQLPVTITGLHIAGLKSSSPVETPGAPGASSAAQKKEFAATPLPPVDVQSISIITGATLVGGTDMFIQAVKGLDLTVQAGVSDQPTLDMHLTGDIAFVAGAAIDKNGKSAPTTSITTDNLRLAKMNFDLARAQQQFGALMPFLEKSGLLIRQGVVTAGFTAAYDGKMATARDVTLALNNVSMDKRPSPNTAPTQVLDNYTMTFKTAAAYRSDAGATTVNISVLDLADNKNLFSVKQNGDTVVHLTAGPDGAAVPTLQMLQKAGITIEIPAIAQVQALLNAFTPPAPAASPAAQANPSNPPPAPVPPLEVTAGSATITLAATGGQKLELFPKILAKGLAVRRGPASYPVGDIVVDTAVAIISQAASPATTQPSVMDQIAELRVERLGISAVASDIHLKEPLVVKDLAHLAALFAPPSTGEKAGAPALNAALAAKGDLGQVMNLLQVLQGTVPATAYAGTYSLDQQVTTAGGPLVAKGNAHIDNFSVRSGATEFAEKSIQLDNDMSLDAAKQSLAISNVALAMQSTNALALKINGGVDELNTRRVLKNITADLNYDAAALWKLIYPTMSAEQRESLKDVKVGGQFQRKILASGEFPANKPFNEAIKTVKAQGGLAIQSFEGKGMTVADLEIPFTLSDGQFRIAYPDKPPGQDLPEPAKCNGGTLALGGAKVDLTQEHPRLNIPNDTKLMTNVSLNAVLAQLAGDLVNNPLFVGADKAAGILNINIVQCDQFPADSLMMQQVPENNGYLKMNVAIGKIQIGNANLQKLSSVLGSIKFFQRNINLANLQGEVPSYTIEIKNGVVNTDMIMNLLGQKQPLHLSGPVVMQTKKMNMTLELPLALLGVQTGKSGVAGLTGGSLRLPMTGTVDNPNFGDVNAIVQKNLVENGVGSLLGGLTGGQKGDNQGGQQSGGLGGLGGLVPGLGGRPGGASPAPDGGSPPSAPATGQPAPGNPTTRPAEESPLGDLGKLFGGDKKKDKDKKKKRKPASQPQ